MWGVSEYDREEHGQGDGDQDVQQDGAGYAQPFNTQASECFPIGPEGFQSDMSLFHGGTVEETEIRISGCIDQQDDGEKDIRFFLFLGVVLYVKLVKDDGKIAGDDDGKDDP